jgi:hypothetical protein
MALTFLNETPIYNPARETLRIVGIGASGHVICRVAKQTLLAYEEIADASPTQLLRIFANHRPALEWAARQQYLTGGQQPDGSILIALQRQEARLSA